jgi:hypothetical protein
MPVDLDVDVEAKTEMEGYRDADGDGEAWVPVDWRDEGEFEVLFPLLPSDLGHSFIREWQNLSLHEH